MKKMIFAIATFFLALTAPFYGAGAATMTFSGVNIDPIARTYSENGIFASGNGTLGLYSTGSIHFDDGGTSAPSTVTFTTGSRFDAVGFDLDPVGFEFRQCDAITRICEDKTFDNVLLKGFDGANLVASLLFSMGTGKDSYPVKLGDAFKNLTAFTIAIALPNIPFNYLRDCNAPCSHFQIDNVELAPTVEIAPVPLPATLPLEMAVLIMLALVAFRRRTI